MKKRIISLILGAICLCTSLVGCNQDQIVAEERVKYEYTQGKHDLTAPETNDFMVENGRSEYQIVVPANLDTNLTLAEAELKYFFEEATGVKLNTISEADVDLSHTAEGKYISLGKTDMLASANVDEKAEQLGSQGTRIITKDKTVYVLGNSTMGTLNAVYTLLEIMFDYDQYAYDCFELRKMNTVKLRQFNVVDVPDIEMRSNSSTVVDNSPNNLQYRLRTRGNSEYLIPIGDTRYATRHVYHNTSNVIPREAEESRETWFSNNSGAGPENTQLCYTTRGNAEDYEALVEQAAKIISESLRDYPREQYPLKNIITFTHEDNSSVMCTCKSCTEAQEKYGAGSGAVLLLANRIREKLQQWMELPENEAYRRDDLKLVFFAYAAYVDAPAKYDEAQGKYVFSHPDLYMRDDVAVYYAISSGFNYQRNIYDDVNKEGIENALKWFDIAKSVYLWTYDANFGNYYFRLPGTNFYDTDAYQFFAAGGVNYMFKQASMPTANVTAFQTLDIYLDAKMQWDTTRDINVLTRKWFKGMFKDAADVMYQLYIQENNWAMIIANQMNKSGIINYSISKEYWKYEMLKGWLEKIDEARALVAKYENSNPALYKVLKEHIDIEWVCPAYYMLEHNGNSLTDKKYNEMVQYFQMEIATLRDFRISERASDTISTWTAKLSLR